MANTIAGCSLALVAQESLTYLASVLAPLSGVITDLSDEVVVGGTTVTTRIPTKPTAASLANYNPSDVSMTAVTCTIPSAPIGYVCAFTDAERNQSAISLDRLFITPLAEALGDKIFGDIWGLFTAARFSNSTTITAANFDRGDLADIGVTLTSTLSAPKEGRTLWAAPAHYAALVKTLNAPEFPGQTADKAEGRVPRTAGFDCYECSGAVSNGENLAAVAFHKSAIVFASRKLAASAPAGGGVEEVQAEIPGLQIPMTFRKWYSPDNGQLRLGAWLHYTAVKGTGMAVRVVTA